MAISHLHADFCEQIQLDTEGYRFKCCHYTHVRGSARVYDSRNTQNISQVAQSRPLLHSALHVWMLWRVPNLRRRVHTAAERKHIHASTEVADADVSPILKMSRRIYIYPVTETGTCRYTWRGTRVYTSGQGMLVQYMG